MRRPLRLRLLLRDLSTGAAFASMAVSGQVPLWALACVALALVVALVGWRPFARAPRLTAVLLLPDAYCRRLRLLVYLALLRTLRSRGKRSEGKSRPSCEAHARELSPLASERSSAEWRESLCGCVVVAASNGRCRAPDCALPASLGLLRRSYTSEDRH